MDTIINKIDKKKMFLVPAGEFIMGSNEFGPETPQRTVHLPDYFIDIYPVTNQEYKVFMDATSAMPPAIGEDLISLTDSRITQFTAFHGLKQKCTQSGRRKGCLLKQNGKKQPEEPTGAVGRGEMSLMRRTPWSGIAANSLSPFPLMHILEA